MATETRGPQGPPADRRDGGESPIHVHTCGRIGMQANPPRARLSGLLRRRQR